MTHIGLPPPESLQPIAGHWEAHVKAASCQVNMGWAKVHKKMSFLQRMAHRAFFVARHLCMSWGQPLLTSDLCGEAKQVSVGGALRIQVHPGRQVGFKTY